MGKAGNGELATTCLGSSSSRRQLGSPLRGTLQQRDQLISGLEDAATQVWRHDRLHCIELFGRITTRVDLGGRQCGVAQPQRNLPDIPGTLQDDHRPRVPEHVGRDAFLGETGLLPSRGRDVLLEQVGKAPSAQRLTTSVDEHLGCRDLPAYGEPGAQCSGRRLPQRQCPLPAPLACYGERESGNAKKIAVIAIPTPPFPAFPKRYVRGAPLSAPKPPLPKMPGPGGTGLACRA